MAQTIIPPIRTSLMTKNGVPFSTENGDIQTAREWWLYWNRLGDQANLSSLQATEGLHGDRPVPDNMPDGAIYVESDRGVIYQLQSGDWVYVAGIMYGTISPDQRPTDLGANDGGFAFTATDTLASDTGRTFAWSGTAWIETSQVLYGTHANRPLPAAAPARCLYAEADRGPLYQNQLGKWVYIAGTMWGTISPDQRPTDLGMFDAGFTFRTNVAPAREFIWSGTAWIEVTQVTGALNLTHPNVVTKVDTTTGQIVEGGITDQSAANSDRLHITAAGNVRIGAPVADAALDVAGTIRSSGFSDPASGAGVEVAYYLGDGYILAYDRSAGTYHPLHINGSITILPSGNVGIGTGGPGSKLSVVGLPTSSAGLSSGDIWRDSAAANVLKIVP